jgi:LysM repeat protein
MRPHPIFLVALIALIPVAGCQPDQPSAAASPTVTDSTTALAGTVTVSPAPAYSPQPRSSPLSTPCCLATTSTLPPSPAPVSTTTGATAAYPPASDRPAFKYFVVAGDTCTGIATKFRTTTDKLLAANGLSDCTQIRVGQELLIPRSVPYDIRLYVVQAGDSFASIAAAFGLKTESLLWSNADQGATPDNLRVGQVLLVPPVDGAIHLVQAGDTLAQVASRYQVTAAVIAAYPANDLPSAFAALLPGSLLVIPGGRLDASVSSSPVTAPAASGLTGFTFAPDGGLYVLTAQALRLLDPATRQMRWTTPITESTYPTIALGGNVVAAIAGGGGYVEAWDARSGQPLYRLADSARPFSTLAFSRAGQTLATGEYAKIRLWDAHTGAARAAWPTGDEALKAYPSTAGITNLAFSQDDRSLFSANWWTRQVMRWDAATHGLQSSFVLTNVVRYDFTPDASHLLADFDQYGFEFRNPRTGTLEVTHAQIIGAAGFETFSADGQRVAVWGYNTAQGSTAAVWELATDTLVQQFAVGSLDRPGWSRAALNADGSLLALSDERADQIHFFDVATGKEIGSFSVP